MSAPLETYQIVNQSDGPPPRGWTTLFDYDGSNNLIYKGMAQSINRKTEWTVGSGALTDIQVASDVGTLTFSAAHGLEVGHEIKIINATDADLNGTYIVATVADTTHVTIVTSNVADATFNNVSLQVYTYAPRKNDSVWIIQRWDYDGSNNPIAKKWAKGQTQTSTFIWDNRTTYAYH